MKQMVSQPLMGPDDCGHHGRCGHHGWMTVATMVYGCLLVVSQRLLFCVGWQKGAAQLVAGPPTVCSHAGVRLQPALLDDVRRLSADQSTILYSSLSCYLQTVCPDSVFSLAWVLSCAAVVSISRMRQMYIA
jgi:hypothetical protein